MDTLTNVDDTSPAGTIQPEPTPPPGPDSTPEPSSPTSEAEFDRVMREFRARPEPARPTTESPPPSPRRSAEPRDESQYRSHAEYAEATREWREKEGPPEQPKQPDPARGELLHEHEANGQKYQVYKGDLPKIAQTMAENAALEKRLASDPFGTLGEITGRDPFAVAERFVFEQIRAERDPAYRAQLESQREERQRVAAERELFAPLDAPLTRAFEEMGVEPSDPAVSSVAKEAVFAARDAGLDLRFSEVQQAIANATNLYLAELAETMFPRMLPHLRPDIRAAVEERQAQARTPREDQFRPKPLDPLVPWTDGQETRTYVTEREFAQALADFKRRG